MLNDKDRIFTNIYGWQEPNLAAAKKRGDWDNTKEILSLGHDEIVERIKHSGLRGRGGAGFPTGIKWSFMPKEVTNRPHYLLLMLMNPKPEHADRDILRNESHKLIEGCGSWFCYEGSCSLHLYKR